MPKKNDSNEIKLIRLYDAPVKTVWQAWIDPSQVSQWWGPRGFTLTTHSKDIKPGGHWHYTMHGPDGVDYPNKTKYFEVIPNSLLVYDHGGNDEQAPLFRVTARFTEIKNKTQLELSFKFDSVDIATQMRQFIKSAGGEATWDRLAEHLEEQISGKKNFVINRSFHAPIGLVFDMFANPEHLSKWLAPTGSETQFIRSDIQVGSTTFWKMTGPYGAMYGRASYLELTRPHRIVYTQQFVDEKENISRHPMAPTWPETMLTTILLSEENENTTRLTITWEAFGKVTPEELETFIQARGGMTQGWTGSFDKLETYLETVLIG